MGKKIVFTHSKVLSVRSCGEYKFKLFKIKIKQFFGHWSAMS